MYEYFLLFERSVILCVVLSILIQLEKIITFNKLCEKYLKIAENLNLKSKQKTKN